MRPTTISLLLLLTTLTITCASPSSESQPPPLDSITTVLPSKTATTADSPAPKVLLANTYCTIVDPAIDAATTDRGYNTIPIVSEIHAGLMKFAERGAYVELQPDLAERYSIEGNGQTYRFVLRQGLKFSDGTPLRAQDVVWSWERALKMAGSTGRALDILGDIQGAKAVAAGSATHANGLTVADERTLIVQLDRPTTDFPMLLTDPVAAVLKKENVSTWGMTFANHDEIFDAITEFPDLAFLDARRPVGAGPFRVTSYSPLSDARTCAIEKNPNYWGQKPQIDYIVLVDLANSSAEIEIADLEKSTYDENEIDYMFLTPEEAAAITAGASQLNGNVVHTDSVPLTMFLLLNPAIPPFDDLNFRKAVAAAADIEYMFEPWPVRWERRILPKELVTDTTPDLNALFDPVAAQTFLASSNYPGGYDDQISLPFNEHYPFPDRLQRLTERWKQLINLNVNPSPTYAGNIAEAATNGSLPIRIMDAYPTYPDPNAVYNKIRTALGNPTETWELNELSRLIDAAANHPDAAERNKLKSNVERFLHEQALAIPLVQNWGGPYILTKPWIHGLRVPQFPSSAFQNVTISDDAPKRNIHDYVTGPLP